ncbi:unnamed protein product [Somion occarium]|uniref:Uncharacterized protein n=1 Tax=Somion occarium TaxID=3059160 RepID=A0ABP1CP21_9APHY
MSSSAETASSSSSSPTTSGSSGNLGSLPSLSSSAALYLYTFLATLVLLLSVSGAIVIRSYVIRRQQREALERAILTGTYVPPPPRRRIDPSKKPTIHDVFLPTSNEKASLEFSHREVDLHAWWASVVPAAAVFEKHPSTQTFQYILPSSSFQRQPGLSFWQRRHHLRLPSLGLPFRFPLHRSNTQRSDIPLSIPNTSGVVPSSSVTNAGSGTRSTPAELEKLQVTFLVVMPSPNQKYDYDNVDELPYVELGTAEVLAPRVDG